MRSAAEIGTDDRALRSKHSDLECGTRARQRSRRWTMRRSSIRQLPGRSSACAIDVVDEPHSGWVPSGHIERARRATLSRLSGRVSTALPNGSRPRPRVSQDCVSEGFGGPQTVRKNSICGLKLPYLFDHQPSAFAQVRGHFQRVSNTSEGGRKCPPSYRFNV